MKKFLAALLAVSCLISFTVVFAGAEEGDPVMPDLDINMEEILIQSASMSYFETAELYNGYFAKGESPDVNAIIMLTAADIELYFEDYLVSYDEESMTGVYNIPAEEYEDVVFTYLTRSDAVVNALRASEYYNAEENTYEISTDVEYDFETELPTATLYGYELLEDGSYAAYSAIMDIEYDEETGDVIPYVPAEDDIEGTDFVYIYNIWSDDEAVFDAESFEDIAISSGYIPVAVSGYVKSIIDLDVEEFVSTVTSFEKFEGEALYESEDMTAVSDQMTPEMEALVALIVGSFVSFEPDAFEVGAVVTTENVTKGEAYDKAAEIMTEISDNFIVYELTATVNGSATEPKGEVKATFAIPSDFGSDFKLYLINDDGTFEELEFDIEYDFGTVSTALTKMGTVIIAEPVPAEEEPEDTTAPETTIPETTAPDSSETTKPAEKPQSPQTGDNAMFAVAIAMIALAACSAVVIYRKKVN